MSVAFAQVFSGDFVDGGISRPELHVLLGLSIMLIGLLRVIWRATTPLPPWADYLSPGERRLESLLEKVLLTLLFVCRGRDCYWSPVRRIGCLCTWPRSCCCCR